MRLIVGTNCSEAARLSTFSLVSIFHNPLIGGVTYLVEIPDGEMSGSQQVHKLLLSLQPCGEVRTLRLCLPKVSLCSGLLHNHELDAVEIAAEDTRDNRIFEHKASMACMPLCRQPAARQARREPLLS